MVFYSFVPTPVALSSAEAENNAGTAACMSMSNLRMMMNDINYEDPDLLTNPPITMYCDSKGGILAANSDKESNKDASQQKEALIHATGQKRKRNTVYSYGRKVYDR